MAYTTQISRRADASTAASLSNITDSRISRLPSEILVDIFKKTISSQDTVSLRFRQLLQLTWICTDWRSIIINTPTFWSTFYCIEPQASLDTLVQRSMSAPLDILMDCDVVTQPDCIELEVAKKLLCALGRARLLTFRFNYKDTNEILPLLAQPTTSVELLRIAAFGSCNDSRPFLANLFGGQAPPRLSSISLVDCDIGWSSPLFSRSLRSLRLDHITRPSYETFVSAFKNMTALQTLHLDTSCPKADDSILTPSDNAIGMPNLTSLYVKDELDICIQFLRTVQCDLRCATIIAASTVNHQRISTLPHVLLDYTRRRLKKVFDESPLSEIFLHTGNLLRVSWVTFEGYPNGLESESERQHKRLFTIQILFTPVTTLTIQGILKVGLQYLPSNDITMVHCDLNHRFPDDFWMDWLPKTIPNVRSLAMTNSTVHDFLIAYINRQPTDSYAPIFDLPFGRLEAIHAKWPEYLESMNADRDKVLARLAHQGLRNIARPLPPASWP